MEANKKSGFHKTVNFLSEFSIPLILGVILALLWANLGHHSFHEFLHYDFMKEWFGLTNGVDHHGKEHFMIFGHIVNFHFFINDIFMVFFFGIAAVEIVQSVRPGGALNPVSKAINPILGTLGGVVGPVGVFFILAMILMPGAETESTLTGSMVPLTKGWGIPTATDIALAWLAARVVFGNKHPAVSYLLLLAIADDAIGLVIIAIFYPSPIHPVEPIFLLLVLAGMLIAFGLRKANFHSMWLYLLFGGGLTWTGLILAHLHPALALVFVIPFMPTDPRGNAGELFEDEPHGHSTLITYEHTFKYFVDFGLLGFGLANAGVELAGINSLTWIIFFSLFIGKAFGISLFGFIATRLKAPLPDGMKFSTLLVAGVVAGLGLTVALFVAGEAYKGTNYEGPAKMGAIFSAGIFAIAFIMGKLFKIEKINE